MKYKMVCVKDRTADVYGVPYFVMNVGSAVRSFGDEVKRKSTDERPNMLNQHPDDFDLFLIGEFDDETAEIAMEERPKSIAMGRDYAV